MGNVDGTGVVCPVVLNDAGKIVGSAKCEG